MIEQEQVLQLHGTLTAEVSLTGALQACGNVEEVATAEDVKNLFEKGENE